MSYEKKDIRAVEALEKIKAILREYDLFAAMTIVSTERVHWLYHTGPSWSCLSIDEKTGEARIKAKIADFVTPEQQHKVVELTTGAIAACRNAASRQLVHMEILYKLLENHFDISHTETDLEYARKP